MNYPSISMQLAGVFQNAAASIGACVLAICMSASLSPATGAEDTIASSNTDMSAKIERYRKANIAGFGRFVKKCQGGSDIKNAQCYEIHNKIEKLIAETTVSRQEDAKAYLDKFESGVTAESKTATEGYSAFSRFNSAIDKKIPSCPPAALSRSEQEILAKFNLGGVF